MNLYRAKLTPKANSDFEGIVGPYAVTVDLKLTSNGMASIWLFSSLSTPTNTITPRLALQLPLIANNEESALLECNELLRDALGPLLHRMTNVPVGFSPVFDVPVESLQRLALQHLHLHEAMGNLPSGPQRKNQPADDGRVKSKAKANFNVRTARAYSLIKAFRVQAVANLLADFEQIEASTATRRITRARDADLIEKTYKTRPSLKKENTNAEKGK